MCGKAPLLEKGRLRDHPRSRNSRKISLKKTAKELLCGVFLGGCWFLGWVWVVFFWFSVGFLLFGGMVGSNSVEAVV